MVGGEKLKIRNVAHSSRANAARKPGIEPANLLSQASKKEGGTLNPSIYY